VPSPEPIDDHPRPRWRLGAALGLTGLITALGAAHLATGAGAEPVDSSVPAGCTLGSSHVDVTVDMNVDDQQDPVTEGGQESLVIKTGAPSIPVEVTINKLVVTIPVPAQIASVDSVTFSGGNVTGSSAIDGSNVVITFTGPQSSKDIQIPTVTTVDTVKAGIAPATISWTTFTELDADTNFGTATCTPNDPNQVLNTTTVSASGSATTVSPTTTPSSPTTTPPTTAPSSSPTTAAPAPGTGEPSLPGAPMVPGVPSAPSLPSAPAVPSVPGAPLPVPPMTGRTAPSAPAAPALPIGCVPVPPPPAVPVPVPVPVPSPATAPCPTPPALPAVPAPPAAPPSSTSGGSASAQVGVDVSFGAQVSL
jgi:hypothetical protein